MAEFAADTISFIKVPSMDIKATGGKKTKANWFRNAKDNTTSTMTVPTTPGDLLLKQIQTSLASCPAPGKCKTKVLEGEGVTVQRQIVKSNPLPKKIMWKARLCS